MNKNRNTPIDIYLSKLSEPQKSTLTRMRKVIAEILPTSIECISYGLPAFKVKGTVIVGFAAAKKHCSYYPFSGRTLSTLKKKLTMYHQTKSALHFSFDKPLSKKTIKLLILTRMAEVERKKSKSRIIKPGGVENYIADCPKEIRSQLRVMRAAILEAAPDSIETVSYFDLPGYSFEGYDYNGMFAWFSYKTRYVRLHLRPEAIEHHKKELEKYTKTRAIVSFPMERRIPKSLVKKLVKSSLKAMMRAEN